MIASKVTINSVVECLTEAGLLISCCANEYLNQEIKGLVETDSRKVEKGSIFIAYKGVSVDSHDYIDCIKSKFPGLLIIEQKDIWQSINWCPAILVKDSRSAWAHIESSLNHNPERSMNFFGFTGTNGKTSSAMIAYQLLTSIGRRPLVIGTLGAFAEGLSIETEHTTPDPRELFSMLRKAADFGCTDVVMEVSSHSLVQGKLGPIRFDGTLFTSFSQDHLDFHGTMQNYLAAKCMIYDRVKTQTINYIHENVWDALCHDIEARIRNLNCYGLGIDNRLRFKIVSTNLNQSTIELTYKSQTIVFSTPLIGSFIIENLIGVLGVCLEKKVIHTMNQLPQLCAQLKAIPGRLQRVDDKCKPAVFVDYAHTPDALKSCLQTIRPFVLGKLICVFGCGGDRDRSKRPIMGEIAVKNADIVYVTSDNPRSEEPQAIIDEVLSPLVCHDLDRVFAIVDRKEAITRAIHHADSNDCVVVAGKGHETYQLIGKDILHFDDVEVSKNALVSRA